VLRVTSLRARALSGRATGGGPRVGMLAWALLGCLLGMGASASGESGCRGIAIRKAIHVAAPQEKVFQFWADYENFPRFMSRVREVRGLGGNRSHWIATTASNVQVEWTSEVINVVPNALIEWRSEPGSSIRHEGVVRFKPTGNVGTHVSIRLCYVPPGGPLGHALATAADPNRDMSEDLKRMKRLIETS
jgi:uncharacterized membrane protein